MKDNKEKPTKKLMVLNAAALLTAVLMLSGGVGVMMISENIVEASGAVNMTENCTATVPSNDIDASNQENSDTMYSKWSATSPIF